MSISKASASYYTAGRDGFELLAFEAFASCPEAARFVSGYRNLRGFRTSVRNRSIRADGVEITIWVGVVWKRKGGS